MLKDHFITVYDGEREVLIDKRDGSRYEMVRERGQMAYLRRMSGTVNVKHIRRAEGEHPRPVEQVARHRSGRGTFSESVSAQANWADVLREVAP